MRILKIMLNYVGIVENHITNKYDSYIRLITLCHTDYCNKTPFDSEDLDYYVLEVNPLEIEGLVYHSLRKYLQEFKSIKRENSIELYRIYSANKVLLRYLIKDIVKIVWEYC